MAGMILVIMVSLLFLGFPMLVPLLVASVAMFLVYFPSLDPAIVVQQMIGGVKPAALITRPATIPSVTASVHAVTGRSLPATSTKHKRQAADGPESSLIPHRLGI